MSYFKLGPLDLPPSLPVAGVRVLAFGESVFGATEAPRMSAAILGHNRQINASIVNPGFIANVRK